MTRKNPELWNKIQEFCIDDSNGTLSFRRRLARENGWSLPFAERAIHEYKNLFI